MKNEIEEKLKILQELYKSDFLHPFPYQDCEKVSFENDFEDFIPSLDLYFSDIAGYCSWGKKIGSWSAEKIETVKNHLQKSFFERFPKFIKLKSKITDRETPQLYNQLLIFDLMRLTLFDILLEVKAEKNSPVAEVSQLPLAI
ncbi:MAG: hypothetical protein H0W45_12505 [Acidobacteria bacterium]|jgi:hypothetical protein|nr:hypothetical protein [Acidobacteriota bacterium]